MIASQAIDASSILADRTMVHGEQELLDLVDENDVVIGQKERDEIHAQGLHNYRVVNVFIINSRGELWIPRRASHKKLFPLGLDMSMGGHVESGETYEDALRRELKEELNIDLDAVQCRFLGHVTPHEHHTHAFENVYEIRQDMVPNYNRNDFVEYFWFSPRELLDKIAAGEKAKNDLPQLVKIFYPSA